MTREETIERLKRRIDCIENGALCSDFGSDKEVFDMAIKALEQEPKTGHWIKWYEQKEDDWVVENIPHCKCSECGTEYDPHSSQFIKYCNECGAKMVEPQESEDKA